MKTFKEFVNEDKTQQISKAAKEVHNFLFGGGGKAIDMENYIDGVLKDHNLSRSERKMVIARVKNVHGYSGKALDKLLSEATLNEGKIPVELNRIKSLVAAAEKAFRDNKDEAGWLFIQAIESSKDSMEMTRLVAQAQSKM